MSSAALVETVNCPLCHRSTSSPWAEENGYRARRCDGCSLIYVNPRPVASKIEEAVRIGAHRNEVRTLHVVGHRMNSKVRHYRRVISDLFPDLFECGRPISWLDVGAGFGEVVEAVSSLSPPGSRIEGIEPMKPKVEWAQAHGLSVTPTRLSEVQQRSQVVSLINVFSHIPDFREFLTEVKRVLQPKGEFLIETGNIADIPSRHNFPGELALPDHLVFAGESHLRAFLDEAGFEVVGVKKLRVDGPGRFIKNVAKKMLGRPVELVTPYTSSFRSILIRARLGY